MSLTVKPPKRVDYNFYAFGNDIYRIGGPELSLCAYLVETSSGLIQVNTVPELFKSYFPHIKKLPTAVCMTSPLVSQTGDTQTGFEFELWTSRFMNFQNPHKVKFLGAENVLKSLYSRLEITMNGDFVEDSNGVKQASFVDRRWVDDVFDWQPVKDEFILGKVVCQIGKDSVKIFDKGKIVFDSDIYPTMSTENAGTLYVDTLLSQLNPPSFQEKLNVIVVGNGIGTKPGITSNFIVRFGDRIMWIDPPARMFEKAVNIDIHPDYITDFIISHCHEDHIEGFSSSLKRIIDRGNKMRLLTTPQILVQLKTIFDPIFGGIEPHIDFLDINDRSMTSNYFGCNIEVRENYHPIPTLGFKFSYNGRKVAISGDILYKKVILDSRLKIGAINKATYDLLAPSWYSDAEFLLHDTTVVKDPVHTDLMDVEEIAQELSHLPVHAYHYGSSFESSLVRATNPGLIL
ncbi:MAG: hypothetical protein SFU91_09450 [Chloroherpetonaceae bacterium]|nr:hypothetical protein [Chloroherpetonaceae bacterium]